MNECVWVRKNIFHNCALVWMTLRCANTEYGEVKTHTMNNVNTRRELCSRCELIRYVKCRHLIPHWPYFSNPVTHWAELNIFKGSTVWVSKCIQICAWATQTMKSSGGDVRPKVGRAVKGYWLITIPRTPTKAPSCLPSSSPAFIPPSPPQPSLGD